MDADLEGLELGRWGESDGEFLGCEDTPIWGIFQLKGDEVL